MASETTNLTLSVPMPTYPDLLQKGIFNAINSARLAYGRGLLKQNDKLDAAAKAHAEYNFVNDFYSHAEVPGKPGYTGYNVAARWATQGYQFADGSEVMNSEGGAANTAANLEGKGALHTAKWTAALFYRLSILGNFSEVGIARLPLPLIPDQDPSTRGDQSVVDLAVPLGQTVEDQPNFIGRWPLPGSVAEDIGYGEQPLPISRFNPNHLVGISPSIEVAKGRILSIDSFTMVETATGTPIKGDVLTQVPSDNPILKQHQAAFVPWNCLKVGTSYTVTVKGSHVLFDPYDRPQTVVPLSETWSFTTPGFSYWDGFEGCINVPQ